MAKTVIDIFKLGARESVKVPAEVFFFAINYQTQASDAVKFNMADRVQSVNSIYTGTITAAQILKPIWQKLKLVL